MRSTVFRAFSALFRRLFGTRVAASVWRVPGAHRFYEWLMPRIRPNEVNVDGHIMHLDRMDSLLLSINGNYEVAEQALFRSCIRPGDTVLDIGAHIGLYTLQAARAVGTAGGVIAFEPATENLELLERNIARNGYSNVTVVAAAVSDRVGVDRLALSSGNTGDHSLLTEAIAGRTTEEVQTTMVDAVTGPSPVDVIKMDIQGGELRALRGAAGTIEQSPELILFTELSPRHLRAHGGAESYLRNLQAMEFALFEIAEDALVPRTANDLADCMSAVEHDERDVHWDLVCVKGDRARRRLGL